MSVCLACPILISRATALLVKIKVLTCNNREYLQNKRVAFHKKPVVPEIWQDLQFRAAMSFVTTPILSVHYFA